MATKRKTALKKKVSKIFYANLPHPAEKTVGNKIYDQIGYPKLVGMKPDATIFLNKNDFKNYWKKVPVREKVKSKQINRELERVFAKYNTNSPLHTPKGQKKIRKKGISHTSMSVGDIIQIGRKKRIVANRGFRKVVIT